jgi:hypothetical protein
MGQLISCLRNEQARLDAALARAAANGDLERVKNLIERGAYLYAANNKALQKATENGHVDVIKYFCELEEAVKAENSAASDIATSVAV